MKSLADRFWEKVRKTETCWLWCGALTDKGYGYLVTSNSPRRVQRAHRVSYTLNVGTIPEDMFVCHHCDRPHCVNPSHLWLGTNADNMDDMKRKGRADRVKKPKGTQLPQAKLTDEIVQHIRRRCRGGETQEIVGRAYGVQQSCISQIVNHKLWKHVP